eukprot:snap_masked-scaffold_9-processed-gene-12.39-mRNA-1 protein AED:0.45 eAED:0.45 QI:0/0/0/1/1/1/2/0/103
MLSMSFKNKKVIVFDNGGLSKRIERIDNHYNCMNFGLLIVCIFGNEVQVNKALTRMYMPVHRSIIHMYDILPEVWYHSFYTLLKEDPREFPLVLSEPHLNPKT